MEFLIFSLDFLLIICHLHGILIVLPLTKGGEHMLLTRGPRAHWDASLCPTPGSSGIGSRNRQTPQAEVLVLGSVDHLTEVGRLFSGL